MAAGKEGKQVRDNRTSLGRTERLAFTIFMICILIIIVIFSWSTFLLVLDLEDGWGLLGSLARKLHVEFSV